MSGPALTIGNHRYPLAELPPQALDHCRQIEFCQQQMARLQRELALLQGLREEAVAQLPPLLPDAMGSARPRAAKRRLQWPSAPASKPRRY